MKLNRRGYIAVEIILASIVSITIAVFLIDITIRLVNRTDNNYIDTIFVSDKALLTKNIKEEIENDISNNGVIDSISCSNSNCNIEFTDGSSKNLSIEGNKVTYGSYTKEVDKRLGGEVKVNSSISNDKKYIIINITFTNIFDDSDYSVIVPISNKKYPPTLAKYITNLYTNASKTKPPKNNGIDYNYASSESLMNDRLGGTTTDLDGGNIRYYGASPNNYIYFNCSDYNNQSDTTCEKWRIIGVFDGKVKIIRNESIGAYSWDTSASGVNSGGGENEWPQADLMKLLNPGYENETVGGSLYYNKGSDTCYSGQNNATKSCDFTSSGIKNEETKNKIAEVTWNLGGWNDYNVFSNQIYGYERGTEVYSGRSTTWTGRIALPYPSDYGYATDFNKCSQNLFNYDNSTDSYACRSNDWMYPIITNSGASNGWLLTSYSGNASLAWYVNSSGVVYYLDNLTFYAYVVAPVLYLGSNVIRVDGYGTIDNPYRIK